MDGTVAAAAARIAAAPGGFSIKSLLSTRSRRIGRTIGSPKPSARVLLVVRKTFQFSSFYAIPSSSFVSCFLFANDFLLARNDERCAPPLWTASVAGSMGMPFGFLTVCGVGFTSPLFSELTGRKIRGLSRSGWMCVVVAICSCVCSYTNAFVLRLPKSMPFSPLTILFIFLPSSFVIAPIVTHKGFVPFDL
ncbi:hypothetical protein VTK73DRAFT_8421 [Phialemonium thermophilum]|uniref:Uncharacterized protein n=1 Tax=Phialemonium thermophilum TaxID=223376 RepID=A0ABR3W8T3_9PEZI